jgi:hypothetical protein
MFQTIIRSALSAVLLTASLTLPAMTMRETHTPVQNSSMVVMPERVATDVVVGIGTNNGQCSGTPIYGTNLVITAAHCVFGANDRDPAEYVDIFHGGTYVGAAQSVVYDRRYRAFDPDDDTRYTYDVAIVRSNRVYDFGVERVADLINGIGGTAVGLQPVLDTGEVVHKNDPVMCEKHKCTEGGFAYGAKRGPVGCSFTEDDVQTMNSDHKFRCRLLQGASGGPVYQHQEVLTLVGVVVSHHVSQSKGTSRNGFVSADKVLHLLDGGANATELRIGS